ncbi:uncharacterized protein LOC141908738 [Tubulanus polymorphus]|uniref:uncharacterized protein LOC141908738 n=1 Tax=Tubulanus polymorphus TaxID=672921 RepID=UPI003DA2480C
MALLNAGPLQGHEDFGNENHHNQGKYLMSHDPMRRREITPSPEEAYFNSIANKEPSPSHTAYWPPQHHQHPSVYHPPHQPIHPYHNATPVSVSMQPAIPQAYGAPHKQLYQEDHQGLEKPRTVTPPLPQQKPQRKNRERVSYTRYQLEILNHIYESVKYPNTVQKQILAHRLGIKREQVKIWFQNRRRKDIVAQKYTNNGVPIPVKLQPKQDENSVVPVDVKGSMLKELLDNQDDNSSFTGAMNYNHIRREADVIREDPKPEAPRFNGINPAALPAANCFEPIPRNIYDSSSMDGSQIGVPRMAPASQLGHLENERQVSPRVSPVLDGQIDVQQHELHNTDIDSLPIGHRTASYPVPPSRPESELSNHSQHSGSELRVGECQPPPNVTISKSEPFRHLYPPTQIDLALDLKNRQFDTSPNNNPQADYRSDMCNSRDSSPTLSNSDQQSQPSPNDGDRDGIVDHQQPATSPVSLLDESIDRDSTKDDAADENKSQTPEARLDSMPTDRNPIFSQTTQNPHQQPGHFPSYGHPGFSPYMSHHPSFMGGYYSAYPPNFAPDMMNYLLAQGAYGGMPSMGSPYRHPQMLPRHEPPPLDSVPDSKRIKLMDHSVTTQSPFRADPPILMGSNPRLNTSPYQTDMYPVVSSSNPFYPSAPKTPTSVEHSDSDSNQGGD